MKSWNQASESPWIVWNGTSTCVIIIICIISCTHFLLHEYSSGLTESGLGLFFLRGEGRWCCLSFELINGANVFYSLFKKKKKEEKKESLCFRAVDGKKESLFCVWCSWILYKLISPGCVWGENIHKPICSFSCVSISRNITTAPSIPIHATRKNSFWQSFITSTLFLNTAPPAFFRPCWSEVQYPVTVKTVQAQDLFCFVFVLHVKVKISHLQCIWASRSYSGLH